jgi:hypothetical protein
MKQKLDRIHKNTKKLVTIDHLLTSDDAKDAMERISSDLTEITDMICIYFMRDGTLNWRATNNTNPERTLYMIDRVKFLLHSDSGGMEGEDDENQPTS